MGVQDGNWSNSNSSNGRLFSVPFSRLQEFSMGFWKWQQSFLLDAVRQFGKPSLFLTIPPFKWSFPFPNWLDALRESVGHMPTRLPATETYAIAHALEYVLFYVLARRTVYPLVPRYALTICKSQGPTLKELIVWFDTAKLSRSSAHVALLTVKTLNDLTFITPVLYSHFLSDENPDQNNTE